MNHPAEPRLKKRRPKPKHSGLKSRNSRLRNDELVAEIITAIASQEGGPRHPMGDPWSLGVEVIQFTVRYAKAHPELRAFGELCHAWNVEHGYSNP